LTVTFEPEMQESQSYPLKTPIIAGFPVKFLAKKLAFGVSALGLITLSKYA